MIMDTFPKTVTLKDGRKVVLRPLAGNDSSRLHAFFVSLPEEDRIFLQHDVTDPQVARRWTEQLDLAHVFPLVAVDGDKIVADGTLHVVTHGWMQHVGQIRLATARTHRHAGLGVFLVRELVAVASERKLEKLQAQFIEDDIGAVKMFEAVGFKRTAVIKDIAKDKTGQNRNLLVMLNDVSDLERRMEDWIQDSMIPAFRVPGAGE